MTINAGDPPDPLPSELLTGTGVGAWLIRPADLDRLPYLTSAPLPDDPERPAPGCAHDPTVDDPPEVLRMPLSEVHRYRGPAGDRDDPYRTPDGDVGPHAPLTLTYRELRQLVALHLTECAATMPRERPWLYAQQRARAMADGETPLRLSEVLR